MNETFHPRMASNVSRSTAWNPVPTMQGHGIMLREQKLRKCCSIHTIGGDGMKKGSRWQQLSLAPRASPRSKLLEAFQTTYFAKPALQLRTTRAEAAWTRFYQSKQINSPLQRQFNNHFNLDFSSSEIVQQPDHIYERTFSLSAFLGLAAIICCSKPADASENRALNPSYGQLGALLEAGVQLIYLGALLILLGVGSFLVVRQVLIKRELETAAKELQDRVRSGQATSLEYFELGAVMLRKKFYQLSRKYLNEAIKKWDGSEQDLAQVYNALGFSYFSDSKIDQAIVQYEKAVRLQPTYVTAWNNLADAYESKKDYGKALKAYEEALQFDPSNKIASAKRQQMKELVKRFQGIP